MRYLRSNALRLAFAKAERVQRVAELAQQYLSAVKAGTAVQLGWPQFTYGAWPPSQV